RDRPHARVDRATNETAREGGDGLQVAALCLPVDGAEGQAGLARTRHAGDRHEGISGQVDVDVLQVVQVRIAHPDHRIVPRRLRSVRSRGPVRGLSHGGYFTSRTAPLSAEAAIAA